MLDVFTWGFGIEHEMHIFHKPKSMQRNIKDFTLFDSHSIIQDMLNDRDTLSESDRNFLRTVPYETSGRRCNEKWVIKPVPIKMPEFITGHPFCSIKTKRDILNMSLEIVDSKKRFYKILRKNSIAKKLEDKYGEFSEYPFGMTRYLKCPDSYTKTGLYKFDKDNVLLPEYNGSYHITMTLPYKDDIPNKDFIKMHQNFCNQLQWLEPLMLAAYFSGDEYAPGTLKTRVRGSFRVMIIGWGNLAGTDVRLLSKGIGRYAKTPTYWRKGLNFKDVDKLKPCLKPSPVAVKEGAITSLSSDFRTFGSTDPNRPEHRESGVGMTKPNGVEFRIFDHFSDKYLKHLLMLVSLVAENSRVTEAKGYVYQDKVWIAELHNIMKNGYKAKLSEEYLKLLQNKLGLSIKTTSVIAIDVFKQIYKELWDKNIDGEWSKIFHCLETPKYESIVIPEINKKAWQFAFMIKLNRDHKLMFNFNFLSNFLNDVKSIDFQSFEKAVLISFDKNWKDDVEDIAYFYETLGVVNLIKNRDGTIDKIDVKIPIKIIKNFNEIMIDYYGEGIIRNIGLG